MKRGPTPGVYLWRDKTYIGRDDVAKAARVAPCVVSYHINRHGNLDRLGIGPQCGNPTGRGVTGRTVEKFGRRWRSVRSMAKEIGKPRSTVSEWLNRGDDDRLLAALMAADARRTAAALKAADMTDRINKRAA